MVTGGGAYVRSRVQGEYVGFNSGYGENLCYIQRAGLARLRLAVAQFLSPSSHALNDGAQLFPPHRTTIVYMQAES